MYKPKRMFGALLALALCGTALAQTAVVTDRPHDLYFGTSKIGSPAGYPTKAACVEAARLMPAPPASTVQRYGCRTISDVVVTQASTPPPPPPPPVCTVPQPALSQTVACPAGSVSGSTWTQGRTATAAAHPTCWTVSAWAPTSPPAGSCPAAPPPPTTALTLYVSDCAAGADSSCVPGSDASDGRSDDRPKRSLTGLNLNALPTGTRVLLRRGSAWANVNLTLQNPNATPTNPLVFDAYGTGPAPVLRSASGNTLNVGGRWDNTDNDGGYTFRNIRFDGSGTADWGIWLVQNVRSVTLDTVDISGYLIGVHASEGGPFGVTGLTVVNSKIHRNRSMGMLGAHHGGRIEGNTFEANNFSGSDRNHGIYYSGGNGTIIRGNLFVNNSVVDGTCLGGQLTAHGQIDGLLIENNTIRVPVGAATCYGVSVTTGYESAEEFKNVVVRGNVVENVGRAAIAANSAPGILIEGNRVFTAGTVQQFGIWVPANGGSTGPGDAADRDANVRNNVLCYVSSTSGHVPVSVGGPGAQQSGNVVRFGADASTGPCAR